MTAPRSPAARHVRSDRPAQPVALGLAAGVDRSTRLLGRRTESNPNTLRYLARVGGYSIEKARKRRGYEPAVDLDEGMRRTEAWLRDTGHLE